MSTKSNVVPIHQTTERESEKKWGRSVVTAGYAIVPSLIFKAQARLGLSCTQLALLLHLVDYWWHSAKLPYPSKKTLAERMHLGERQVQRYLTELENAGFIRRIERFAGHKGQQSNMYDLKGLVDKLKKLEPEFRQVREEAEINAREVTRPGGLTRFKKETEREQK